MLSRSPARPCGRCGQDRWLPRRAGPGSRYAESQRRRPVTMGETPGPDPRPDRPDPAANATFPITAVSPACGTGHVTSEQGRGSEWPGAHRPRVVLEDGRTSTTPRALSAPSCSAGRRRVEAMARLLEGLDRELRAGDAGVHSARPAACSLTEPLRRRGRIWSSSTSGHGHSPSVRTTLPIFCSVST